MATQRRADRGRRVKKQPAFLDTVTLQFVPDPEPRMIHKSVGRRTKLGISAFVWNLFKANEELPKTRRLTNTALLRAVRDEFGHRKVLMDSLDCHNTSINDWRRRYNTRTLAPSLGDPVKISLRYDNNGDPVEPRLGRRKLSRKDVANLCVLYEIEDDRYRAEIAQSKAENSQA